MSRLFPIASSSSGNCTYIGHKTDGILIDIGISCKAAVDGLALCAIEPKTLGGIFITHEHNDHISGLRVFSKKFNIPVFASLDTCRTLQAEIPELSDRLHPFDNEVAIGNMLIRRFNTSHDCQGSSGYTVTFENDKKCAVCTDLGIMTEEIHQALLNSSAVLLESNHDVMMLQKGSYPPYLKNRILSDKGHLSNIACASELCKLAENGTTRFVLGHLSRENNRPEIAENCAEAALMDKRLKKDEDYTLYVAPPKGGNSIIF